MDRGEELDHGVAEELEPLVVRDAALGGLLLAELGHDVDQDVQPCRTQKQTGQSQILLQDV